MKELRRRVACIGFQMRRREDRLWMRYQYHTGALGASVYDDYNRRPEEILEKEAERGGIERALCLNGIR